MQKLRITAGGQTFSASLADRSAARALADLLPLSLDMTELNGNEKYGTLPQSLPVQAERVGQICAGDLMLYGSDCLVLFYESFRSGYRYTRLGKLDDAAGLAAAVGRGGVRVTIERA